jgi:G3E family GTPase
MQKKGKFDYILLETTGLAGSLPLARLMRSRSYRLDVLA